jgi:hypothetical protein
MEVFVIVGLFFGLLFVAFTLWGDSSSGGPSRNASIESDMAEEGSSKIRVKHYTRDLWVVQERETLGFWRNVTKAMTGFTSSTSLNEEKFPAIYSKQEAVRLARHLSIPGNLSAHIEEQKQIWLRWKATQDEIEADRRKVVNI